MAPPLWPGTEVTPTASALTASVSWLSLSSTSITRCSVKGKYASKMSFLSCSSPSEPCAEALSSVRASRTAPIQSPSAETQPSKNSHQSVSTSSKTFLSEGCEPLVSTQSRQP